MAPHRVSALSQFRGFNRPSVVRLPAEHLGEGGAVAVVVPEASLIRLSHLPGPVLCTAQRVAEVAAVVVLAEVVKVAAGVAPRLRCSSSIHALLRKRSFLGPVTGGQAVLVGPPGLAEAVALGVRWVTTPEVGERRGAPTEAVAGAVAQAVMVVEAPAVRSTAS
jgi:hypothetical protein